jgi:hypothetical protein
MIQNYYTLVKLTNELKFLIGMKLIASFSQEKDSITFNLFDGTKETFLHFSAAPFSGALFVYNKMVRAKKNTIDVCKEVVGDVLQNITIINKERIIELQFINYKIICHIFGGGNANLFLCDKKNKIIFALNNSQNCVGNDYKQTEHTIDIYGAKGLHNNQLDNIQIIDYLTKADFLFGKPYAMQFCYMNDLVENNGYERKMNTLSKSELNDLQQKANEFANYLITHNQAYIMKAANSNTSIFSLIPLENYEIIKIYESTSDAIKYQLIQNLIERKKSDILKEILPKLKREQIRITQNIKYSENIEESLQRADKYRTFAELLMSQTEPKQKLGDTIDVED